MRVSRRRVLGIVAVGLAVVAMWVPSLVATRFTSDVQHIDFISRPDRGWRFLYDAIHVSRHAVLGTEGAALGRAQRFWWPPSRVRIDRVELVYLTRPVTVPLTPGGRQASVRDRTVRPRSRFTWFVHGRIGNRPQQVVGLMDLRSGRVFWDIRRTTPLGAG